MKAKQYYKAHNDRALKAYGLSADFTFDEFEAWFASNVGKPCPCGAEARSIDHVIPLARGGAHALSNFQFLCRPCNSRKGAWLEGEVRVYPWQRPGFIPHRGPKKPRKRAKEIHFRPAPGSIVFYDGRPYRVPE